MILENILQSGLMMSHIFSDLNVADVVHFIISYDAEVHYMLGIIASLLQIFFDLCESKNNWE